VEVEKLRLEPFAGADLYSSAKEMLEMPWSNPLLTREIENEQSTGKRGSLFDLQRVR
jgi:hypothetical protein